jgi:hypothetical protein
MEDLSNSALADTDILTATPPAGAADTLQPAPDTGASPPLLGGLVPFPTTAKPRGPDNRLVLAPATGRPGCRESERHAPVADGDGVNVSDDGRAELNFQDFNVQIFRHAQHQMIPSTDPGAYGLGYDLVQGATLNTIATGALQQLTQARIGVLVRSAYSGSANRMTTWLSRRRLHLAIPSSPSTSSGRRPGLW